jgi:hypothetical protein
VHYQPEIVSGVDQPFIDGSKVRSNAACKGGHARKLPVQESAGFDAMEKLYQEEARFDRVQ